MSDRKANKATEEELAEIIEKAVRLKVPPTFMDILLAKMHTFDHLDVKLLLDSFKQIESAEQNVSAAKERWEKFWVDLSDTLDVKFKEEAERMHRVLVDELTGEKSS